jgi:ribosome-associated heat shock protein Hsp15
MTDPPEAVRADRWLWAARFFKTRALAAEAITGGKVHAGGTRIKPARDIRIGDELEIAVGQVRFAVTVLGLAERRGPAREAALLYAESDESRAQREAQAAARRVSAPPRFEGGGRPTKRDRRRLESARRPRGR